MLTLGIDDAGRGPLIGPMILAGVLLNPEQEKKLKKENVRDSKTIYPQERTKLFKLIKENSEAYKIVQSSPEEIDSSLKSGTNLNTLEAIKAAEIINTINTGKFQKETIKTIIDCPSVNTKAWLETLLKYIKKKGNLRVICEHKADANYVSAAAGSILAKATREKEVEKIRKEYGNIGSGYPSDPTTKEFLKKHGKELANSGIFRKTWSTWKKLFPEKNQATLENF